MTGVATMTRDELAALQTLSVRLLFCHRTQNDYRENPGGLLHEFRLPEAAAGLLPDVDSDNFLAESQGRRSLVLRTAGDNFPRTAAFFDRLNGAFRPRVPPLSFDAFLSSDAFLGPEQSLPHPQGLGPGYESVSKFFFWLRDRYGLRDDNADADLRAALYGDFAVYLLQTRNGPHDPYYDRFKGGVHWRERWGHDAPVIFVSEALMASRIGDPAKATDLAGIGIVDLDALEPEPVEPEFPI